MMTAGRPLDVPMIAIVSGCVEGVNSLFEKDGVLLRAPALLPGSGGMSSRPAVKIPSDPIPSHPS